MRVCKSISHRQIKKKQKKKLLPTKALKFKISKVPLKQAKPQQTHDILGIRKLSPASFKMYKAWWIVSIKNHSRGKDWICDGISYATVGLRTCFLWRGFSARKSWPRSSCSQRQWRFLPFFIILHKGIILIRLSLKKNPATHTVIKLKGTHIVSMWLHIYTLDITYHAVLNTQTTDYTRQRTHQLHSKQIAT